MNKCIRIIKPIKSFKKIIEIEGDKSLSIRWVLLSSLSKKKSVAYNILKSVNLSQLENIIKDRLTYCLEWKQNIDVYLANKSISKKANQEYYKSRPLMKLIINFYFIPYNLLRFYRYLRIIHDYKKNEIEIKVLSKELERDENQK